MQEWRTEAATEANESKLSETQERVWNAEKETINEESTTAADGRKNKAQSS